MHSCLKQCLIFQSRFSFGGWLLPVTIVNADRGITIAAAELKSRHPIAYADCFAAALGISKKAKVITGDPEFKRLGEEVKVEWI